MNRPFGVPALAGPDRLKAGHQTSGVPQTGSRSQCAPKMAWVLSMNRSTVRQVLECLPGRASSPKRWRADPKPLWFIVPMHGIKVVEASHKPDVRSPGFSRPGPPEGGTPNKRLSLGPSVKNFGGSGVPAENAGGFQATTFVKPAEQQQPRDNHHRPDHAQNEKVRRSPAHRVCVRRPGLVCTRAGQQSEPSRNTEKLLHLLMLSASLEKASSPFTAPLPLS